MFVALDSVRIHIRMRLVGCTDKEDDVACMHVSWLLPRLGHEFAPDMLELMHRERKFKPVAMWQTSNYIATG